MGEGPLLPGYRRSQTYWLSCPEARKPTSSSPAGGSTSLSLTVLRKPRPRAHGPAGSEGPYGSWRGWGAPWPTLQLCRAGGGWVGAESCSQARVKKGSDSWARWPPTAPHSGDAGRPWLAVLGEVGMASLLILSPKSPASPSQGARLRPWAWPPLVILPYCGRGAAAAAPLLAALALGSVACNDSPSEEGMAQRAQGTQPVSQPGQVTLHFSSPAHYHVTSQSRLSPQPSPLLVALPSPASQGTCRKLTHSNQPTKLCGL